MALLKIENLRVRFRTRKGVVEGVQGVSFALEENKTLALVGESGSGKSVTAMAVLRLLDDNGEIVEGKILFENEGETLDLLALSQAKMRQVRGNKISVIFQEPMTALNPVLTVKRQLREPFIIHQKMSKKEAIVAAEKMLEAVRIPNPKRVLKGYAHQLSGGMRQRVMIAMALACKPRVLIADEPTTALDVTIQAQILRLMKDLQKQSGAAILFITHDLGVVNETADEVAVMYCGQIVETAEKKRIFQGEYSHPYTEGLLASLPSTHKKGERLEQIQGSVPPPNELPKGCKFSPRCRYCTQKCVEEEPPLFSVGDGKQKIRCFYPLKEERKSAKHAKLVVR